MTVKFEAEALRAGRFVVRPAGSIGMGGWIDGVPWQCDFCTARQVNSTIARLTRQFNDAAAKLKSQQ